MPQMTGFTTGMFNWTDLATTDVASAKRFYGELFGWSYEDAPAGDHGVYSMAKKEGQDVAAISGMMPEQLKQGVTPYWTPYIWVDDVEARAQQVAALGGKLVAPPFDVMDAGRMCVVQDPTGAMVALWQEKTHKGAGVMKEPGTFAWVELMTPHSAKAQAFYTQLLGWKPRPQYMGDMDYTAFFLGEPPPVAGMVQAPDMPPHWLVYFATANCNESFARARKLGGRGLMPPTAFPGRGRVAVVQDPQGAFFALFEGRV